MVPGSWPVQGTLSADPGDKQHHAPVTQTPKSNSTGYCYCYLVVVIVPSPGTWLMVDTDPFYGSFQKVGNA